ncbi:unnamed protein product [Moneuplotes crassus]|uniref:Uncharacterized protein n=1 Tax=Euplotes crassus TaxID=5936 RepID=A0AAD1Y9S1_EUPCR|nr:unnamed protein product [Moneuplotes crassus]
MEFPRCEYDSCKSEAQFYLKQRKMYVCSFDKDNDQSRQDTVCLTHPDSVVKLIKIIDLCRKELLMSPTIYGYLAPEEEYSGFDLTVKERTNNILSELKDAMRKKLFYKFEPLFQESQQVKEMIMNDRLYIKFCTMKTWKESVSAICGEGTQSLALVEKEISDKYNNLLEKTVSKLMTQKQTNKESYDGLENEFNLYKRKNKMKLFSRMVLLISAMMIYFCAGNIGIKYSGRSLSLQYTGDLLSSEIHDLKSKIHLKDTKINLLLTDLSTLNSTLTSPPITSPPCNSTPTCQPCNLPYIPHPPPSQPNPTNTKETEEANSAFCHKEVMKAKKKQKEFNEECRAKVRPSGQGWA